MYNVSDSVRWNVPKRSDRPCSVKDGRITIYVDAMHVGLRFPMQPYFHKVVCASRLAPVQLNTNAYRFLAAYYVLYQKLKLGEPSLSEVMHAFT